MNNDVEIKAIRLLQERATDIGGSHKQISSDLASLRAALALTPGAADVMASNEYSDLLARRLETDTDSQPIEPAILDDVLAEACSLFPDPVGLRDILSEGDFREVEERLSIYVSDFNKRFGLDGWDYAIAGSCALLAAMLDLLCVRAPAKPTASWSKEVDGIFNRAVQKAFNGLLPPDLCKALSKAHEIGGPDTATAANIAGVRVRGLNPVNHRLRSLAHDPLLGFIFGVLDARNGTFTMVVDGAIRILPTMSKPIEGTPFQLLGRIFGHLLSDVNAPTVNGNRGMGLPAPLMGLLRMLESIPVGNSDFGKQIEFMFANGYDFRQLVVTGIPVSIMEVLMRVFFIAKQVHIHDCPFGQAVMDTMPGCMNPRFRTMLALAYGTSSAVNAGKVYVTGDILNASYASWMGLVWNGFHALRWSLFDRHAALWSHATEQELKRLRETIDELDTLVARTSRLPV